MNTKFKIGDRVANKNSALYGNVPIMEITGIFRDDNGKFSYRTNEGYFFGEEDLLDETSALLVAATYHEGRAEELRATLKERRAAYDY